MKKEREMYDYVRCNRRTHPVIAERGRKQSGPSVRYQWCEETQLPIQIPTHVYKPSSVSENEREKERLCETIELELPHHAHSNDGYNYWWGGIDALTAAPILTQPYYVGGCSLSHQRLDPHSHAHSHTESWQLLHQAVEALTGFRPLASFHGSSTSSEGGLGG
jgi:hypothetical protein